MTQIPTNCDKKVSKQLATAVSFEQDLNKAIDQKLLQDRADVAAAMEAERIAAEAEHRQAIFADVLGTDTSATKQAANSH